MSTISEPTVLFYWKRKFNCTLQGLVKPTELLNIAAEETLAFNFCLGLFEDLVALKMPISLGKGTFVDATRIFLRIFCLG